MTNSSWPTTESFQALEIKTSMLFNLDFANSTMLSWFFFIFLITDLNILTAAVITQIFTPITELVIPIGIPTKETNTEMETHPELQNLK